MAGPRGDQPVVRDDRFLGSFVPAGVVRVGIELLGAFGGGHQMKDRVVVVPELDLVGVQLVQHIAEFLVGHVGAVVQRAAVTDDKHFLRLEGSGDLGEDLLLGQHQLGDAVLILPVVAGILPGRAAVGELGGGFIHEEDAVALFREGVLDPAHGGGLSGTGAACDDDPRDLLLPVQRSVHSAVLPFRSVFFR